MLLKDLDRLNEWRAFCITSLNVRLSVNGFENPKPHSITLLKTGPSLAHG